MPRGSRQILTRKRYSYPFAFCVVFAGLLQGAKGIPAKFDPQILFLPFPVLCGICRTFAGRQGDPGKFLPANIVPTLSRFVGICRTFAGCQGDPGI